MPAGNRKGVKRGERKGGYAATDRLGVALAEASPQRHKEYKGIALRLGPL